MNQRQSRFLLVFFVVIVMILCAIATFAPADAKPPKRKNAAECSSLGVVNQYATVYEEVEVDLTASNTFETVYCKRNTRWGVIRTYAAHADTANEQTILKGLAKSRRNFYFPPMICPSPGGSKFIDLAQGYMPNINTATPAELDHYIDWARLQRDLNDCVLYR